MKICLICQSRVRTDLHITTGEREAKLLTPNSSLSQLAFVDNAFGFAEESFQRSVLNEVEFRSDAGYGLDCIVTKLKETSEVMIHACVLYMNLR